MIMSPPSVSHRTWNTTPLIFIGLFLVAGSLNIQAQESKPVPVSVVRVKSMAVHDVIPLSGTLTARREVRLSPRVEGYVEQVLVDAGDDIVAGAIVVELDRKLAEIELSRAKAARVEAQVRHDEARRQLGEVTQLVEKNHVAGTTVANARAEVAIQAAAVQRLSTDIVRQNELLRRHTITAPFSGVVSAKLVEIGQWVETSTALIGLSEVDALRVEVAVPQSHFAAIQVGTPVELSFDALPGFKLSSTVSKRVAIGDGVARTFPVHIDIGNSQRRLAPGMSVRVRILANHTNSAIVLPLDAIVREPNGAMFVWRVETLGGVRKGVRTDVIVGRSAGDWIEVLSEELTEGMQVVVHGNERLREDLVIEITEELSPPA